MDANAELCINIFFIFILPEFKRRYNNNTHFFRYIFFSEGKQDFIGQIKDHLKAQIN